MIAAIPAHGQSLPADPNPRKKLTPKKPGQQVSVLYDHTI